MRRRDKKATGGPGSMGMIQPTNPAASSSAPSTVMRIEKVMDYHPTHPSIIQAYAQVPMIWIQIFYQNHVSYSSYK
jgi:hypothetical protein